jgi:tRNA uridine 5-carboxymethylaminomethyl modification enzyme
MGEPFVLGRDEAYTGVLIDDLVNKGVGGEPYRMFSSRAEHRLLLREDNADRRLMPGARALGLLDDGVWARFCEKRADIERTRAWADQTMVRPDAATAARFEGCGLSVPRKPLSIAELLRRPEVDWNGLEALVGPVPTVPAPVAEQVETDTKYAGYLKRQVARTERTQRMQGVAIPAQMDFALPGLSTEVAERLSEARPQTLGAASRLPGVTPAAIDVLSVHLARRRAP